MSRMIGGALGSLFIGAAIAVPAMFVLGAIAMTDCVLSDAEIAAGLACENPSPIYFWAAGIISVVLLVLVQILWWRRILRPDRR